ncbi:hypothetical protein U1Q18_039055, partial [Sarracenia purpurea var. burkii]
MAYANVKKAHSSGLRTEPAKTTISSVEQPTLTIPAAKPTQDLVVRSVGTENLSSRFRATRSSGSFPTIVAFLLGTYSEAPSSVPRVAEQGDLDTVGSRIAVAMAIGVALGCAFAFLYPPGLFVSIPAIHTHRTAKSTVEVGSSSCESSERDNIWKSEFVVVSEKNTELKSQIRELTEKLQLAEQEKDNAQKRVLVFGEQHKDGPFGMIKSLRTNPTVIPDDSVNPRL